MTVIKRLQWVLLGAWLTVSTRTLVLLGLCPHHAVIASVGAKKGWCMDCEKKVSL